MRKIDKKGDAAIWVTPIDMKAKKVYMKVRIVSKRKMAIGFRNYWAATINNLLDDLQYEKYK